MLSDVVIGAVTKGVNKATFAALNLVFLGLWAVIAYMFYTGVAVQAHRWLAPHAALMLAICTLLWIVVVWMISQTGLTTTEEQAADWAEGQDGGEQSEAELQEKLKALPLQSDMGLFSSPEFGFDSTGLQIKPLATTALNLDTKDKEQ